VTIGHLQLQVSSLQLLVPAKAGAHWPFSSIALRRRIRPIGLNDGSGEVSAL
jgi:hypothetical protein